MLWKGNQRKRFEVPAPDPDGPPLFWALDQFKKSQADNAREGNFRMRWKMHRNDPDAPEEKAMKYAAPGKLAIVYGTPEGIDPDGTIVLHYHYIRIVSPAHFSANELDYGRLGQPFKPVDSAPTADATAPPSH